MPFVDRQPNLHKGVHTLYHSSVLVQAICLTKSVKLAHALVKRMRFDDNDDIEIACTNGRLSLRIVEDSKYPNEVEINIAVAQYNPGMDWIILVSCDSLYRILHATGTYHLSVVDSKLFISDAMETMIHLTITKLTDVTETIRVPSTESADIILQDEYSSKLMRTIIKRIAPAVDEIGLRESLSSVLLHYYTADRMRVVATDGMRLHYLHLERTDTQRSDTEEKIQIPYAVLPALAAISKIITLTLYSHGNIELRGETKYGGIAIRTPPTNNREYPKYPKYEKVLDASLLFQGPCTIIKMNKMIRKTLQMLRGVFNKHDLGTTQRATVEWDGLTFYMRTHQNDNVVEIVLPVIMAPDSPPFKKWVNIQYLIEAMQGMKKPAIYWGTKNTDVIHLVSGDVNWQQAIVMPMVSGDELLTASTD
jgi:hypothetical protein